MKKRIAIFSGSYPGTTFVSLLITMLSKNSNSQVQVFAKKIGRPKLVKTVQYHFMPQHKLTTLLYALFYYMRCLCSSEIAIKNYLRQNKLSLQNCLYLFPKDLPILVHKTELLHIQWLMHYKSFKPLLKANPNLKLIVSLRGAHLSIKPFLNDTIRQDYYECFEKSWKIHSISDDLTDQALSINPNIKQKLHKINPAINTTLFKFRGIKPMGSPVNFITVSRLNWKKNIGGTLVTLSKLKQAGINFTFNIIGEGHQKEEILFLLHDLNLSEEVKLLGKMSQKELVNYLINSDAFLLNSVQEGFSNAVLEAQCVGLPCIVSNAEGLSENVKHKKTGLVYEKYNREAQLEAIFSFLAFTSEDLSAMQLNAHKRVVKNFDVNDQIKEFHTLYSV